MALPVAGYGALGPLRPLRYRKSYKYQVAEKYVFKLPFKIRGLLKPIKHEFWEIHPDGTIVIYPGYAWDGASGPTWDTYSVILASLIHDILYQAMRWGKLSKSYKPWADRLLHDVMIIRGATAFRAGYYKIAVEKFGDSAIAESSKRKILIA